MSSPTVAITKFVGTISLGLLTGLSYTLSTTTLPPLLLLPTATPAHSTFRHLRALTLRHQVLLSTLSASSLLLAYALSPSRARHPYLLWATLAIGSGFGRDVLGLWTGGAGGGREGEEGMGSGEWDLGGEGDGEGEQGGVNGEALREGMEGWRARQAFRTAVWGVGWLISVVGIWGDGA